jgi:hypothetical protein
VQVGTSRFPSVSGGADYPFTFEKLREELVSVVAPPAAGIHLPHDRNDADQTRSSSMLAVYHVPADERKSLEIEVLRREERMTDEVRDDPPDEIVELARLPLQRLVTAVRPDASAPADGPATRRAPRLDPRSG